MHHYRAQTTKMLAVRGIFARHASTRASPLHDIVVVGGGMVGNAMACALGQSPTLRGCRVLLLESGTPKSLSRTPPEKYANRVSAVAPGSAKFFQKLGIWQRLKSEYRMQEVTDLYVADGCSAAKIRFNQLDTRSPIAWIVENDAIVSALYDRIGEACPGVTVEAGCRVDSCSVPDNLSQPAELQVTMVDGSQETIRASLLIGADGARSVVRSAMGVDYTQWQYNQSTIVGTLQVVVNEPINSIAWQRFTPLGPLGILPLSKELSSLAWTTSTGDAHRLMALPEDQFVDELNDYLFNARSQNHAANVALSYMNKAVDWLPGTTRRDTERLCLPYVKDLEPGTRGAFPVGFGQACDYVRPRAVLIGDAAHRIHPLAGQGVNLGWFDVRTLLKCLERAAMEGADLGAATYLADYDTKSQRRNVPIMSAIDGLNRLYSTEYGPAVVLRSLGVNILDRLLPPLKDLMIHEVSD